ncbi:MAG: alcohol dehydrogenase catalytic domain-containing protein [Saccharothrix sp.]|nr:alcohol dehydrogenase catalytic domain-containing protein [Saccharothrix sp.]
MTPSTGVPGPTSTGAPLYQATYVRRGSVAFGESDAAEPGPGQVRVEVAYTGVCGTDLHIFRGHMDNRVAAPQVIGHEMSGRIAALGPGVTGWAEGDAVTVMPLDWCGECPACRGGLGHICHRLSFIGIDAPGSMRQSWVVDARTLVAVPDGVSLRDAALVEPTAVAVHDVRRAGVVAGERVLVVGGGPVGLLIAVVARHTGAEVLVAEPDPARREVARSVGLRVVDPVGEDLAAVVDAWTDGAGVPVAFEVSGAQAGVASAVDALGTRGRLCLVAIHPTPREVDLHRFFWRELVLVGARLYERSDFEAAVALIADGTVPTATLVTRVEPLDRAQEAFEALANGVGEMKILIDCGARG